MSHISGRAGWWKPPSPVLVRASGEQSPGATRRSRALGEPRSTSWPSWRQQVHDLDMKSRVHPKYKTKYHVGNWPAYDRALVQRGDITGGFDGEIGILELPAPPADASRCPRGDRVRREPEGDVASPHEGSVVLGPVPDAIRCLVLRMHSRLHIEIMTRLRSRWSTCRPLLAHRAESAHQRPETLWPFLGECLAHFSPDECRNYVRHCGYAAATRS